MNTFRNLYALVWLAMGAGWGYWAHRRLIAAYGRSWAGRFLANWVGMTCYFLGIAGLFVLLNGGLHRGRSYGGGPVWSRLDWPEALVGAAILGVLAGLIGTLDGWGRGAESVGEVRQAAFPEDYVEEILAAEQQASAEECRRMARHLRKKAQQAGEPLPPRLQAFVARHQRRERLPRGG